MNDDSRLDCVDANLARAEEVIQELQAENEELKTKLDKHCWIPVSERLPKSPTDYLCCDIDLPAVFVANTWSKADGFWQGDSQVTVTHWKPIILPESEE